DRDLVQKEPAPDQQSLQTPAGGQEVAQHDEGRGGAPAVRLDMDLDVDVQMKAKIQGDVTLSILRRRRRKIYAAAAGAAVGIGTSATSRPWTGGGASPDPELSSALESLTAELQGTSDSIRRLTRNKPSHRNCEVYRGLVESEARIQARLSGLQTSVNNMRNLHPGLE
ncbi:hypothetical protein QBC34DRAFT_259785, partial [Podospora aff. communis PSN243]